MKKFLSILLMVSTLLQAGFVPCAQAQVYDPINPEQARQVDEIMKVRARRGANNQVVQTIYWGQSVFYQYADGTISAPHYTKQTIRDFASLLRYMGYRQINWIPAGYHGSIPNHLRDFAWWTFAEYGIQVLNYRPTPGIIYWGTSTFYVDSHRRIYANHYSHKTIDDLARLYYALGVTHVAFIPYGQRGAIPGHLRGYAIQRFAQYGIQVVNDDGSPYGGSHRGGKKGKGGGRKPKPEEVILEFMLEIIKNS